MISRCVTLIVFVVLALGCTSNLTVHQILDNEIPEGVVYFLPQVEYEITVKRELIDCQPLCEKREKEKDGKKETIPFLR